MKIDFRVEEPRFKKIYGFRNDWNNSYLNSSLQLLTRIKELKKKFLILIIMRFVKIMK